MSAYSRSHTAVCADPCDGWLHNNQPCPCGCHDNDHDCTGAWCQDCPPDDWQTRWDRSRD